MLCETVAVSAPPDVPPLVARALDLSRKEGFITATRTETGRLLAALAASRTGTLAELGTGCGVGSAWLDSGITGDARVVTAELDPALAEKVQELFVEAQRIEVTSGDWSTLERYAPFSLLFVDVRDVKRSVDVVADLMGTGGMVVLDDFTPCQTWPPVYAGRVDVVREQWLADDRFTAVEVMVAEDASVVIATRR
jgi:predicted O-methyltransferase YrrM